MGKGILFVVSIIVVTTIIVIAAMIGRQKDIEIGKELQQWDSVMLADAKSECSGDFSCLSFYIGLMKTYDGKRDIACLNPNVQRAYNGLEGYDC
jgi:hypothetical protein